MGSEALCFRVVRPAVRAYVSTYDRASVSVRVETFSDLLAADFQFFNSFFVLVHLLCCPTRRLRNPQVPHTYRRLHVLL